jgi:hypothetical protein
MTTRPPLFNMALPFTLLLTIFTTLSSAVPLSSNHRVHYLVKRGPPARKVGTGIGIAISIAIFAAIVFYLGVRRGYTGTWFCWREPVPVSSSKASTYSEYSEKRARPVPKDLRNSIGFPKLKGSSVPFQPSPVDSEKEHQIWELSPVSPARPRFLELPTESNIHEIGERRSWIEEVKRRSSWFCRGLDRTSRVVETPKRSLYEMDAEPIDPPAYPEPAMLRDSAADGLRGSGAMNWEGLEWIKKIYGERRSVNGPGS